MNNTKRCPYCSEEIPVNSTVCQYCGENVKSEYTSPNNKNNTSSTVIDKDTLNTLIKVIAFVKSSLCKKILISILIVGIIACLIWVLGFDYPAVIDNADNFGYGPCLSAGILHTLLAILCALIILIIK